MCGLSVVTEEPLEFLRPLSDTEVMESQTAILECEVSRPNLTARWLKAGKPISGSDKCEIVVEETVHRLVMKDAQLDDQAQYTIEFADGKTSAASIFVTGADET